MNRLAWIIASRELAGGVGGFLIYLTCIALGVFAIAAAGSVTEGFSRGLASEARTLLGGDAMFTASQRRATPDERAWMEARGRVSERISLNVMGEAEDNREQGDLRAVDEQHPLLGEDVVFGASNLNEALSFKDGRWGVAVTPSLLEAFGLEIGDDIQLGNIAATLRERRDAEEPPDLRDLRRGPRHQVGAVAEAVAEHPPVARQQVRRHREAARARIARADGVVRHAIAGTSPTG